MVAARTIAEEREAAGGGFSPQHYAAARHGAAGRPAVGLESPRVGRSKHLRAHNVEWRALFDLMDRCTALSPRSDRLGRIGVPFFLAFNTRY